MPQLCLHDCLQVEKGKKHKNEQKNEKEVKTKDEGQKDDNYKSKEEGKLGVYWFKDSGHKKHGWKNVYHKEEWGDSKKFHDIFHDKDWKKKWNKWDSSKEKSKGSKYKSDKKRFSSKKLDDEKKVEKGGHKKWKHEHGSGYEKKEHLDTHQEHESHEKKSNAHKLKGNLSKNNRSVRLKKPKVSESQSPKYPSASNVQEHRHDYGAASERDHHQNPFQSPYDAKKSGSENPIADSIDFRQSSPSGKHKDERRKVRNDGGQRKRVQKSKDVTSRRVKHYPNERKNQLEPQKVREHESKDGRPEEANRIENSKNFNQKKVGGIKEIETNLEGEEEEREEEEGGNIDGGGEDARTEVEDGENEQEVPIEDERKYDANNETNRKKGGKNSVLSSNEKRKEEDISKNDSKMYYVSSNIRSSRPSSVLNDSNQRLNANLQDYNSQNSGSKIFYRPYSGKQPLKQLLVTPPYPSSTVPIMYPPIPIPASTAIYGPTVPIIEHQPNAFQATHFVPSNNIIYRRPGLAFLSVLRSLTSVPVLLPTSTTGTAASSLISSPSTTSSTKLLYHPVTSASSPSPKHISSFSYHLEQLQRQKASMGKSSK